MDEGYYFIIATVMKA